MNILVIEDSRFLRALISKTLTRAGYAVTAVSDGEKGILAARAEHPSLILLDMMLPGLDGTSVLRALKEDAVTALIPVVVMSGLSQRNEARLKQAGAAAYVEKTLLRLDERADALIPVVESAIRRSPESGGITNTDCSLELSLESGQPKPRDKENLR